MTGYVADLSWKSGARAIEKLDRLRSAMAVNVLRWRRNVAAQVFIELTEYQNIVSQLKIKIKKCVDILRFSISWLSRQFLQSHERPHISAEILSL